MIKEMGKPYPTTWKTMSTEDTSGIENYLRLVYPGLPAHKVYEKTLARYFSWMNHAEHDKRVTGLMSKSQRQIDVWLAKQDSPDKLEAIVEAKYHGRKLTVQVVDSLIGVMRAIGVSKAYLISPVGFSKSAENYSKKVGIETQVLSLEDAELSSRFREHDYSHCHECDGNDSRPGWVDWSYPTRLNQPMFGRCLNCNWLHFLCPFCESSC